MCSERSTRLAIKTYTTLYVPPLSGRPKYTCGTRSLRITQAQVRWVGGVYMRAGGSLSSMWVLCACPVRVGGALEAWESVRRLPERPSNRLSRSTQLFAPRAHVHSICRARKRLLLLGAPL
jgi:hypothetical protein